MPITQERMLALLEEYEQFVSIHDDCIGRIRRVLDIYGRESDLARAIEAETHATQYFPRYCVREERKHFNRHAKRNIAVRRLQANARRAKGIPERDSDTYRVSQMGSDMRGEANRQFEREYIEAMQGRVITDADIAPYRGEALQSFSESRAAWGKRDEEEVKAERAEADGEGADASASRDPPGDTIVLRDKLGNTVTQREIDAMNARGIIEIDDLL